MARARNHIQCSGREHGAVDGTGDCQRRPVSSPALTCRRSLAAASSLDDMLMRFHRWARDLGLAGATCAPVSRSLAASVRRPNHTHLAIKPSGVSNRCVFSVLGRTAPLSGAALNGPELLVVLPEAKAIGSVAMSLLGGDDAHPGVDDVHQSRRPSHYQQGQGTQLLAGNRARCSPELAGALD